MNRADKNQQVATEVYGSVSGWVRGLINLCYRMLTITVGAWPHMPVTCPECLLLVGGELTFGKDFRAKKSRVRGGLL